jgi:hypothetical protein
MVALVGTILASSYALIRYALGQTKEIGDRFVSFLEASLRRQEESHVQFRSALDGLQASVRENSALLERIAERKSH